MKKTLLLFLLICGVYIFIGSHSEVVIPKDAIRLRILANSNSSYDQEIKGKVKESVENTLSVVLKDSDTIEESRVLLNENLNQIEKTVANVLKENNVSSGFKVDYGMHYFPPKEYRGVIYEEGEYESLLITLGNGFGDNFWCVLFPPFCLVEAKETDLNDVEYRSFVKDMIERYF